MYKIIGADKQEYGPVTDEQVRQWVAEGRANAQTLVRREDEADWKSLGTLPEFAGLFAAQTPPPPSPTPPGASIPPTAESTPGLRPHVPNYLVQAILVTLCCCLPFGIVAIVYAAQVNSKLDSGDIAGATAASNNAKLWCWIGFGAGAVAILVYLLLGAVPQIM
jgi:hypothetical protein